MVFLENKYSKPENTPVCRAGVLYKKTEKLQTFLKIFVQKEKNILHGNTIFSRNITYQ